MCEVDQETFWYITGIIKKSWVRVISHQQTEKIQTKSEKNNTIELSSKLVFHAHNFFKSMIFSF